MRVLSKLTIVGIAVLGFILTLSPSVYAQTTQCDITSSIRKLTQIKIVKNSDTGIVGYIHKDGYMDELDLEVEFAGDNLMDSDIKCLQSEIGSVFTWDLKVEYWDGGEVNKHYILPSKLGAQRKGFLTGDGWQYTVADSLYRHTIKPQDWGSTYGGGIGTVQVRMDTPDRRLTASESLSIVSKEIEKNDIRQYLADPKYQILGFLETRFIHFLYGKPLLNCGNVDCSESDGGFGLMQITNCPGTAGALTTIATKNLTRQGYPSYRQIWDWKANADAGKSCYEVKVNTYCDHLAQDSDEQIRCGLSRYNGSDDYGQIGITLLNEVRNGRFRTGWF